MTHKDLNVWKQSMNIVTDIYRITKDFPKEEKFGLTNQIRRSAISIPSNIAEGAARTSKKEFSQFISIALGSCAELDTQIILAESLGYLKRSDDLLVRIAEISKMLVGLRKSLRGNR